MSMWLFIKEPETKFRIGFGPDNWDNCDNNGKGKNNG